MACRPIVILAVLSLFVAPVVATGGPLDAIPANATVVVRFRAPAATVKKVATFANQIEPSWGFFVTQASEQLGGFIENEHLVGVDSNLDWYVATLPGGDVNGDARVMPILYVIPAQDLKAMKLAVGEKTFFDEQGKYGVYTTSQSFSKNLEKQVKAKSIDGVMDFGSRKIFDQGEVGVYVNLAALAKPYVDEWNAGGGSFKSPLDAPAGIDAKAFAKFSKHVADATIEALQDINSLAVSLQIEPSGLSAEGLLKVKYDSNVDKFLQRSPPSSLQVLDSLPPDSLGYLGVDFDATPFVELTMELLALVPQFLEQQSTMVEMAKQKNGAMATSFRLEANGEEGDMHTTLVYEVADTAKQRELNRKNHAAWAAKAPDPSQRTLLADAEKYGKNSADVQRTTIERPKGARIDGAIELLGKVFDQEPATTKRTVYLTGRIAETSGGGPTAMTRLLAGIEQPACPPPVKAMREKLGGKSNLLWLMDYPSAVWATAKIGIARKLLRTSNRPGSLDALKIRPSFLGVSIATEPGGVRLLATVPVEQFQGLYQLLASIKE